MTTLAANASVAVVVPAGNILVLAMGSHGGSAIFGVGQYAGQSMPLGPAQTLGPWPVNQTINLCAGGTSQDYVTMPANLVPAMAKPVRSGLPIAVELIAQSHVTQLSTTGDAIEHVLASVLIPGGIIGPNGSLRARAVFSGTNSVNTKTMRMLLNGVSLLSGSFTSAAFGNLCVVLENRNSLSSQINSLPTLYGAGSGTLTAIDTSVDTVLTIAGTLTLGTETMAVESFAVEVLPG